MTRSRKRLTHPLVLAFALATSALCGHASVHAQNAVDSAYTLRLNTPSPSSADDIINFVMFKLEGSGYVANDNGHGPSRWGILGASNGLSPAEVWALTPQQAADIYKQNYWNAIDADNLSYDMRLVAYNAAVQFGPPEALSMVAQADGDPVAVYEACSAKYERLVDNNPVRYSGSLNEWKHRQRVIATYMGKEVPHDFDDYAPPDEAQVLEAGSPAPTPTSFPSDDELKKRLLLWGMIAAPFVFLLGAIKTDDSRLPDTPQKTKASAAMGSDPFEEHRSGTAGSYFSDRKSSDFRDAESAAFDAVFGHHTPAPQKIGDTWRVAYPDHSHLLIAKGQVSLYGDGGIEDTLKYAALAWGNQCVISGGTKEFRDQMIRTAQKLVDEGTLSSGFKIEGVGTFTPSAVPPRPTRSVWAALNALKPTYQPG